MQFESGKVTFFDRAKSYGFLTDANGQRVYFRLKAGRIVDECSSGDEPELSRSYQIRRGVALKIVDRPKVGDELYFVRGNGRVGPCANLWCCAVSYRHTEELIRARKAAQAAR